MDALDEYLQKAVKRHGTVIRGAVAPSGTLYVVDAYETITVDSVDLLYVYAHEAE